MKVIIKGKLHANTFFDELDYGSIFLYQNYYCMKIYDNETNKRVGLVLNEDCDEYMETILIDDGEPIFQEFPNSQIIIE